jgi:hypothetical protein
MGAPLPRDPAIVTNAAEIGLKLLNNGVICTAAARRGR